MKKRSPKIIGLRAIRKTSHITKRVSQRVSGLLEKVEHKTTRLIVSDTGSPDGSPSVSLSEFMHAHYPQISPLHPALPMVGQRPSVTVFAFLDPRGFYGGIATLLIVAASLAKRLDYDLRIVQTTGYSKSNTVIEYLKRNGIDFPESRFSTFDASRRSPFEFSYLPIHPEDVVMVSAWWDAHVASQLPLKKKFVYLIQDFEPIFYNNSDDYLFADQTYYSEKFIPICNTELLYSFFKEKGYRYITDNAIWFEPAPAPKVESKSSHDKSGKKNLFLYGRPSVHRNLFFTALQALELAFTDARLSEQKNDWQLFCAGQNDIPFIKFSSGLAVKNLGKMSLDDYYSFAATVDVAVSPMLAPHPNYPTLEMASLGSVVVSTKYETKQDLGIYSNNILMAEPTVEDVAEKIIDAVLFDNKTRIQNIQSNKINDDWSAALRRPVDILAQKLES